MQGAARRQWPGEAGSTASAWWRRRLEAQIGRLTLRARELAVDVRELERQSPFTL